MQRDEVLDPDVGCGRATARGGSYEGPEADAADWLPMRRLGDGEVGPIFRALELSSGSCCGILDLDLAQDVLTNVQTEGFRRAMDRWALGAARKGRGDGER